MASFLQRFRRAVAENKERFRLFLAKLESDPSPRLDVYAKQLEPSVWQEINCLSCANCCSNMSPVYTTADIKRIATHLRLSVPAFKEKWLYKNEQGAWMNRSQPCQFLDLQTNRCSIYAVRPDDCAGFPHLAKKDMAAYMHVHKQNITFCPATYRFVEKLMQKLDGDTKL